LQNRKGFSIDPTTGSRRNPATFEAFWQTKKMELQNRKGFSIDPTTGSRRNPATFEAFWQTKKDGVAKPQGI